MQDITKLKSPHERKVYAIQTSTLSHLVVTIRYLPYSEKNPTRR